MAMSEQSSPLQNAIGLVRRDYDHFMQNTVLRSSVRNLSLEDAQWRDIERLVSLADERWDYEIDLHEGYAGVLALLAFAHALMSEAKPRLQTELAKPRSFHSRENRVVLSMTVSSISDNVRALREHLSVLYAALIELDQERNGRKRAVHQEFPSLARESIWSPEAPAE
jgi:hypothetical protein